MNQSQSNAKISLALVDDHTIFRSGLKLILSNEAQCEVVIEADNGQDFLDQLNNYQPDVVLLDISMPILDGYQTTLKAIKAFPDLKIIVLSMLNEDNYYYKMIEAGAKGFVLKNSDVDELKRAIDEVARGNNYFTQDFLKKMVLKINNKEVDTKLQLSEKEKEVLQFICNGFTNAEISEKMFLSTKSIERYRNQLLQKTQARNTAQLVRNAIVDRWIEL
ncbi:MAG: response regulator [Salinivirgaceae bacterium]